MKPRTRMIILVAVSVLGGVWLGRSCAPANRHAGAGAASEEAAAQLWTCAMHPQIQRQEPGLCPICAMELVPVDAGSSDAALGPRALRLSAQARKRAEVEVAPVERKPVTREIRMSGKVDYDETRVRTITARMAGRLDRLYVDYTGIRVQEGDHLVTLYSPELVAAQEELIQAKQTRAEMEGSNASMMRERAGDTLRSAREKLRLLGLTEEQIEGIEQQTEPTDHITVYAPISGVVLEKHANEGMYVETGSPIYTIADLSKVWVRLDAYESDMEWIRYGQPVTFEAEARPGKTFEGRVVFEDPVVDPTTRTVKVRVNVSNPEGELKPGMFIRAVISAQVSASGRAMNPDLAGKWVCPMHPEIVRDEVQACDICGMDLVPVESLGYEAVSDETAPLVIPATAPLITGRRAVVYVQTPGEDGVYEGREIRLGSRADDYYVVEDGLREGELVVTRGAFKIDSAIQIRAGRSMMSPDEDPASEEQMPTADAPEAFRSQLQKILAGYFAIQSELAADSLDGAQQAAAAFSMALASPDTTLLHDVSRADWMRRTNLLANASAQIKSSSDIDAARTAFSALSMEVTGWVEAFRPAVSGGVFVIHCPMAFENDGADWLQNSRDVHNPYFGARMLKCGAVKRDLYAEDGTDE